MKSAAPRGRAVDLAPPLWRRCRLVSGFLVALLGVGRVGARHGRILVLRMRASRFLRLLHLPRFVRVARGGPAGGLLRPAGLHELLLLLVVAAGRFAIAFALVAGGHGWVLS